ncbi:MAG TPA: hypothetical protein VNO21_23905 [Polyangiaceae bacterium]|nr:hypothetical protein [Polyangiaceae bacterium]
MTPQELKKALIVAGFEVYRTNGDEIVLADRVRDNLILDSGVRVRASSPLEIRLIMGLRRAQYPSDDEAELFNRVRQVAAPLLSDGFLEVTTRQAPVADPADANRTLDTFYEVIFSKKILSLEDGALRLALRVAKMAESRH